MIISMDMCLIGAHLYTFTYPPLGLLTLLRYRKEILAEVTLPLA